MRDVESLEAEAIELLSQTRKTGKRVKKNLSNKPHPEASMKKIAVGRLRKRPKVDYTYKG